MIGAVDTSALLELAWVAPLAVLAVSISYSLVVVGATKASDHRRVGNRGTATAYAVLGVVSAVVFAAEVVAGVAVIVAG